MSESNLHGANSALRIGIKYLWFEMPGNERRTETQKAVMKSLGKEIAKITLDEDILLITFVDGMAIRLWDNGQDCCEARYMRTDDDLSSFVGATLTDIEIRSTQPVLDGNGEPHEIQFLLITTSKGVLTMSSHNEHNGYYGGFSIRVALEEPR